MAPLSREEMLAKVKAVADRLQSGQPTNKAMAPSTAAAGGLPSPAPTSRSSQAESLSDPPRGRQSVNQNAGPLLRGTPDQLALAKSMLLDCNSAGGRKRGHITPQPLQVQQHGRPPASQSSHAAAISMNRDVAVPSRRTRRALPPSSSDVAQWHKFLQNPSTNALSSVVPAVGFDEPTQKQLGAKFGASSTDLDTATHMLPSAGSQATAPRPTGNLDITVGYVANLPREPVVQEEWAPVPHWDGKPTSTAHVRPVSGVAGPTTCNALATAWPDGDGDATCASENGVGGSLPVKCPVSFEQTAEKYLQARTAVIDHSDTTPRSLKMALSTHMESFATIEDASKACQEMRALLHEATEEIGKLERADRERDARFDRLQATCTGMKQELEELVAERERRRLLGTAEGSRLFDLNVLLPNGLTLTVQVHASMQVNEICTRALAKAAIDVTRVTRVRVALGGNELGHLMRLGEVGVTRGVLLELSYELI